MKKCKIYFLVVFCKLDKKKLNIWIFDFWTHSTASDYMVTLQLEYGLKKLTLHPTICNFAILRQFLLFWANVL